MPGSPSILSTPIEQIEIMIGEALLVDDFGSKSPGDAEKRAVARRWFESNLAAIQGSVCGSVLVREAVFSPKSQDRNALLGALVDVLGTRFGLTVPVAALSVMVIHYGLGKLCPALESSEETDAAG